jgi:hypothetical protein
MCPLVREDCGELGVVQHTQGCRRQHNALIAPGHTVGRDSAMVDDNSPKPIVLSSDEAER